MHFFATFVHYCWRGGLIGVTFKGLNVLIDQLGATLSSTLLYCSSLHLILFTLRVLIQIGEELLILRLESRLVWRRQIGPAEASPCARNVLRTLGRRSK